MNSHKNKLSGRKPESFVMAEPMSTVNDNMSDIKIKTENCNFNEENNENIFICEGIVKSECFEKEVSKDYESNINLKGIDLVQSSQHQQEKKTYFDDFKNFTFYKDIKDENNDLNLLGSKLNSNEMNDKSKCIENENKKYLDSIKNKIGELDQKFSIYNNNIKKNEEIQIKKWHICNICGKKFSYKSHFDLHKIIHKRENPNVFETFKQPLNRKSRLQKCKIIHTGEKEYAFETCKKSFHQKSQLNKHKIIHTGEKPYTCETCKKSFNQKCHLDQHKIIHTGEKPHACETCKQSFTNKSSLNQHKKIHTGEKPHVCETCRQAFSRKDSLNKHKRIHTGEKPYVCETCNLSFNQKTILNRHKKIHTGEKPYVCEICNQTFSLKGNLNRHKISHR